MYKFAFDSDALIKLAKAGVLEDICRNYSCSITNEVKNESVNEGKKRLHEDALKIEDFINKGLLKVIDLKISKQIKENLGKGEISVLRLYFQEKNSIVVTDDSAFIKHMNEDGIRFAVPADIIFLMKTENKLDRKTSLSYLDKIKEFIKEEVYNEVKQDITEDSR